MYFSLQNDVICGGMDCRALFATRPHGGAADEGRASGGEQPPASEELFRAVLPVIPGHLKETPLTIKELSADFGTAESQMRKWMDKAVAEKCVRKLKKPVRFELNIQGQRFCMPAMEQ